MKLVLAAALVLCMPIRRAAADDAAARVAQIQAMLAAQIAALVADDEPAFLKTLSPGAPFSLGQARVATDQGIQSSLAGPAKIELGETKIGWTGTWGWVAADVRFYAKAHPEGMRPGDPPYSKTPQARRWIALVVADGDGVKTRAMELLMTRPDRDVAEYDAYNDVQALAPRQTLSPLVALLAHPGDAAKLVSSDPATAVFGSARGDVAFGPAAAKKLLASWSRLPLDVPGPSPKPGASDVAEYTPVEVTAGDATFVWSHVRIQMAGAKRWALLQACAIARNVGGHQELLALGYGSISDGE